MKTLTLTLALALSLPLTSQARSNSSIKNSALAISSPFVITGVLSVSSLCNYKCFHKVVAAREDAAFFVASGGEIRTAVLEEALAAVREVEPDLEISDFELASLILQ